MYGPRVLHRITDAVSVISSIASGPTQYLEEEMEVFSQGELRVTQQYWNRESVSVVAGNRDLGESEALKVGIGSN